MKQGGWVWKNTTTNLEFTICLLGGEMEFGEYFPMESLRTGGPSPASKLFTKLCLLKKKKKNDKSGLLA